MKRITSLLFVFFTASLAANAQLTEETIISRIAGYQKMYARDSVRVMGFTKALKQKVEMPGPMLEYEEGDSVEITLWNVSQGPPHTIHLHGLDVNQENDGVPALSFVVEHMKKGVYRMKVPHPGTYLYHCHVVSPLHVQAGMYGMLVVKPAGNPKMTWKDGYTFHTEYRYLLNEVDRNWHTAELFDHDHNSDSLEHQLPEYNPQYFLINNLSHLQYDSAQLEIKAQTEANTLLRLANIGNLYNQYIFPEQLNALVISSDGRPLPSPWKGDTLEIFPGERYQVLLQSGDKPLVDSILINYKFLANDATRGSRYLHVQVADFSSVTDVDRNPFTLYPNPASTSFRIELENKTGGQFAVLNHAGSQIAEGTIQGSNVQVDMSKWQPGLYMVRVQENNSTTPHFKKLVVY